MTKTEAPPGVVTLENERVDLAAPIPASAPLSARALLDRALNKADADSPDGHFTITIDDWGGAGVTLRRLSYAQVSKAFLSTMRKDGTEDQDKATRLMLRDSLVDPVFSVGEINELMDDPAQLGAAMLLSMAVNEINKTGLEAVANARAAFRRPSQ